MVHVRPTSDLDPSGSSFELHWRDRGDTRLVRVVGSVDGGAAEKLLWVLSSAPGVEVVVDLCAVTLVSPDAKRKIRDRLSHMSDRRIELVVPASEFGVSG